MAASGPTVTAEPASNMPFTRYPVADIEATDFLSDFNDLAHVLMAHVHGHRYCLAGPVIPLPDMNIRAADGCFPDLDQDVVMANNGSFNFGKRSEEHTTELQ